MEKMHKFPSPPTTSVNVGDCSTNHWVINAGRSWLLFDIGWPGSMGTMSANLTPMGVPLGEIRCAFGSHSHIDHLGLEDFLPTLADFKSEYNIPVVINEFGVVRWEPGASVFMYDEMSVFEVFGINSALLPWSPAWAPCAESNTEFFFKIGPDPGNTTSVDGYLLGTFASYWSRKTLRPSSLKP